MAKANVESLGNQGTGEPNIGVKGGRKVAKGNSWPEPDS